MMVLDEYQIGTALNTCYLCKAARRPDEKVIDTGIHIDFEGFLAICESCIVEAAGELGLLTRDKAERLYDKMDRLATQLDEARIRADAAEAAVDSIRRYELVATPAPAPAVTAKR